MNLWEWKKKQLYLLFLVFLFKQHKLSFVLLYFFVCSTIFFFKKIIFSRISKTRKKKTRKKTSDETTKKYCFLSPIKNSVFLWKKLQTKTFFEKGPRKNQEEKRFCWSCFNNFVFLLHFFFPWIFWTKTFNFSKKIRKQKTAKTLFSFDSRMCKKKKKKNLQSAIFLSLKRKNENQPRK